MRTHVLPEARKLTNNPNPENEEHMTLHAFIEKGRGREAK